MKNIILIVLGLITPLLSQAIPEFTLDEVLVEADRVIPIHTNGMIMGQDLLANPSDALSYQVILLACYIHTQSIGEKEHISSLADKYAIAQCVLTRIRLGKCKDVREFVSKSNTIKKMKTRYFWIDSEEYFSWQCLLAASNVIHHQIPKAFRVDNATSFVNVAKRPGYSFKKKTVIKTFKHTFYYRN